MAASNPLLHSRTSSQIKAFLEQPAHALALVGEDGAGKSFIAQYISNELLNNSKQYTFTVDASVPKTGIEEVREAQKFLTLTVPGKATIKRVLIIEHLDSLGHEAQNSLLKTLEEPPVDTVIITTFSKPQAVLVTIHSRIHPVQILPVSEAAAVSYFADQPTSEVVKAHMISSGAVGLMSSIITNDSEQPLLVGINHARELLTSSRYQRLATTEKLLKQNTVSPSTIIDGLYRLLQASYHQALSKKSKDELKIMAQRLRLVEQALDDLAQNVQAKLVFDRLFLEL